MFIRGPVSRSFYLQTDSGCILACSHNKARWETCHVFNGCVSAATLKYGFFHFTNQNWNKNRHTQQWTMIPLKMWGVFLLSFSSLKLFLWLKSSFLLYLLGCIERRNVGWVPSAKVQQAQQKCKDSVIPKAKTTVQAKGTWPSAATVTVKKQDPDLSTRAPPTGHRLIPFGEIGVGLAEFSHSTCQTWNPAAFKMCQLLINLAIN